MRRKQKKIPSQIKQQVPVPNDYSKLRLQLFYLDELVQLASESLCKLDGVNIIEEARGEVTPYLPEKNPISHQRTKGALDSREEIKNEIFRSFGPEDQEVEDQIIKGNNSSSQNPFACLQPLDYGPQFDELSTFGAFDFGRDRSSLKRQRLFFRERLPSNNIQPGGREALVQMRKQGSFLFREYKVPDRTEIQQAIAASQIPNQKNQEENLKAATESNDQEMNFEIVESSRSSDKNSDQVFTNQLFLGSQIVSEAGGITITTSGENNNNIEKAAFFSSNNSCSKLEKSQPIFEPTLAPQLSKHYSNTLNATDSISFQMAQRRDRTISFEPKDFTTPQIVVEEFDQQQESSDCLKKINDEIHKILSDTDCYHSQFSFSLIQQQRKAFHKFWNDKRCSSFSNLKESGGNLNQNIATSNLIPPQPASGTQYQQSMNSVKSERSNSLSEFERSSSSSQAGSDDSVRSDQYAQQLNSLATEKISIAQKKLNKELVGPIGRKMSVCYDESYSFSALRAASSQGSGKQSDHRRSNSIFLSRPRNMSHFQNELKKGQNVFNGAAGPASGSDSSMQTFGTPQLPNNQIQQRQLKFKKKSSNIGKILTAIAPIKLDREHIKHQLYKASWINKEDDELQIRKDELHNLRKLAKKLKGTTNPACLTGIIPEEDHNKNPTTLGSSNSSNEAKKQSGETSLAQSKEASQKQAASVQEEKLSAQNLIFEQYTLVPNKVTQAPTSVLNLIRCSPIIEEEESHEDHQNIPPFKKSFTLFKILNEESPQSKSNLSQSNFSSFQPKFNSNEKKKTPIKQQSQQMFPQVLSPSSKFGDSFKIRPQNSSFKSSQSLMLSSLIAQTSLVKRDTQWSPAAKSNLSNLKTANLKALKNNLRDLDTSLHMDSECNLSLLSPKNSQSPNRKSDAEKIMKDLRKSMNKRQSMKEQTQVDKELDGLKLQMNRMFSKIAQGGVNPPSIQKSSSQSSNDGVRAVVHGYCELNKSFNSSSNLTKALRKSIERGVNKHKSMRMNSDQIYMINQITQESHKVASTMNLGQFMDFSSKNNQQ